MPRPERAASLQQETRRMTARGLNLNLFIYADGHHEAAFADEVMPILRRRGLFRTAYEGTMLHDHCGLPRPESGFALAQRQSSAA
ncbi:MAG: nitrilotriacetate monooxygenase component [Belnapia sp.]|nr:nitrilotriacetate monooxygenase component [Belnapia sp.]